MRLRDFLDPGAVRLELQAATREDALAELLGVLRFAPPAAATVLRQLQRREALGSTGFGAGIAIPHCRTLAATRLHLAFGRSPGGIPWEAVDGGAVHAVFLIVAPPTERASHYLPVLGRIAQFVHEPSVPPRLRTLAAPADLLALLEERGL